jgi:hypothetical protein
MLRIIAVVIVLLPFVGGCAWQANNASQRVDINPFNFGSGQQVISPSNYQNGQ